MEPIQASQYHEIPSGMHTKWNNFLCFPCVFGSISDVELTRESGYLNTLKDKPGISIMADTGFTIKYMLKDIGIELNIPPFMEGRTQLPSTEVQEGRRIASVRIHVERAIGRFLLFPRPFQ